MTTKLCFLFLFVTIVAFGQSRDPFNNIDIVEHLEFVGEGQSSIIDSLTKKISQVRDFISSHSDQVELMAITSQDQKPIKVIDGKWPDGVTTSINIIRNENGRIKYYAEYPLSESGDWFIGYQYYFQSSTGKVYAFRRQANFFNGICVDGVVKEQSTYYFAPDFSLIGKDYSLRDNDGNDLKNKQCFFNYDHPYNIVTNSAEL